MIQTGALCNWGYNRRCKYCFQVFKCAAINRELRYVIFWKRSRRKFISIADFILFALTNISELTINWRLQQKVINWRLLTDGYSKKYLCIEEHKRGFRNSPLSDNFQKFASTNLPAIEKLWALLDCWFIGVNFSKLTHNNQIFRNGFVCNHYHLCKLSALTIECKIFTPTI